MADMKQDRKNCLCKMSMGNNWTENKRNKLMKKIQGKNENHYIVYVFMLLVLKQKTTL